MFLICVTHASSNTITLDSSRQPFSKPREFSHLTHKWGVLANQNYVSACMLTLAAHHIQMKPQLYTTGVHLSRPSCLRPSGQQQSDTKVHSSNIKMPLMRCDAMTSHHMSACTMKTAGVGRLTQRIMREMCVIGL